MGEKPLVIAYHLIWTAYGTWLPNDPRGSGSTSISVAAIEALGEPHFGRKRVQPTSRELSDFQTRAAATVRYPVLRLDPECVATAFGAIVEAQRYTCYACAIMPDHVHMLIRKHKHEAEQMIDLLRAEARNRLIAAGLRADDHPTWSAGWGWKVFLYHPDEIRRTIRYIEANPLPRGLPAQQWDFVKPYDGWPLHSGHSPSSPYVRGLRAAGRL
jgi:REP element-mobilizing transposase RayT